MGAIMLPDELERVIASEVAAGRAESAAAFLHEAVLRLAADATAEEAEILAVAEAGSADIADGRFTTVSDAADEERLHSAMLARLRAAPETGR